MSCAAAVAAFRLIKKRDFKKFQAILQGDQVFFEWLSAMGADFFVSEQEHNKIKITIHPSLLVGIEVSLSSTARPSPYLSGVGFSSNIEKISFLV
jgi:hypothetical protein